MSTIVSVNRFPCPTCGAKVPAFEPWCTDCGAPLSPEKWVRAMEVDDGLVTLRTGDRFLFDARIYRRKDHLRILIVEPVTREPYPTRLREQIADDLRRAHLHKALGAVPLNRTQWYHYREDGKSRPRSIHLTVHPDDTLHCVGIHPNISFFEQTDMSDIPGDRPQWLERRR